MNTRRKQNGVSTVRMAADYHATGRLIFPMTSTRLSFYHTTGLPKDFLLLRSMNCCAGENSYRRLGATNHFPAERSNERKSCTRKFDPIMRSAGNRRYASSSR